MYQISTITCKIITIYMVRLHMACLALHSGYARKLDKECTLTYVSTPYQCPEMLYAAGEEPSSKGGPDKVFKVNVQLDVWNVGCMLAQFMKGGVDPVFPRFSLRRQVHLRKMIEVVGMIWNTYTDS